MSDGQDKKAQVLLVEDNLSDAILVRTILEREGDTRVTLAQDGIRGCQLVESHRWDMVITDFNLPGRDGIEVIFTCKEHQPDTPIISLSAYSASVYREGAIRGGASEALVKPIDPEELHRTARRLLKLGGLTPTRSRVVLAVGAFPGDVEVGCAGTLMKYAMGGDTIHALVLSLGPGEDDEQERIQSTAKACRILGATLHLPPAGAPAMPDLDAALPTLQDAVRDLEPELVFAPSANDVRESRREVQAAAAIAVDHPTSLLCYQAATTTLDFRPTLFEDVSDFLDMKMAALSHFLPQVQGRPHLHPDLARATARYWGRYLGYGEVEPFEIIRHKI